MRNKTNRHLDLNVFKKRWTSPWWLLLYTQYNIEFNIIISGFYYWTGLLVMKPIFVWFFLLFWLRFLFKINARDGNNHTKYGDGIETKKKKTKKKPSIGVLVCELLFMIRELNVTPDIKFALDRLSSSCCFFFLLWNDFVAISIWVQTI